MKHLSESEAWDGRADCVSCGLRNMVLFAGLEEKDFELIHQPIDLYSLPVGKAIYRAGERGDRMFTIRSGLLKLVQYLPDGGQRIVRLARSTDVIGMEALLGQPYEHDAVVIQTTEACSLPVAVVQALAQTNPKLHRELMLRWQRALSEADAWLTQLSTGSAKERMARLLLRLIGDDELSQCTLFSREDMGAMLGITTETASRTIAEFKRQRLVSELGSNQYRLDRPNLQRIAED